MLEVEEATKRARSRTREQGNFGRLATDKRNLKPERTFGCKKEAARGGEKWQLAVAPLVVALTWACLSPVLAPSSQL